MAGREFSGILLQRRMPDGSNRFVCTNEVGVVFFDLGLDSNGKASVYSSIDGMPRRALVGDLARDIRMVWRIGVDDVAWAREADGSGWVMSGPPGRERYLYRFPVDCIGLVRCERMNGRKVRSVAVPRIDREGWLSGLNLENKGIGMNLSLQRYEDHE